MNELLTNKEIMKDFITHLDDKIFKRNTHYRKNLHKTAWLKRTGNNYRKRTDKLLAIKTSCQEAIKAIEEYVNSSL